jgi:hypothetical protein
MGTWEIVIDTYKQYKGDHLITIQMPDLAFDLTFPPCYGKNKTLQTSALIAAAPDLLAALQKIVNNWDDLHPKDRQQARFAIAKAKGG